MDPLNEPFEWDAFVAELRQIGYTRTALEEVARLESDIKSEQLVEIYSYLSEWRNLTTCYNYGGSHFRDIKGNLEVFKSVKVPLFIDNYGCKRLLNDFGDRQPINVDFDDSCIFHVTHKDEADKIQSERKLLPSSDKNILPGCWFGLGKTGKTTKSAYGSYCFSTTLRKIEDSLNQRDGCPSPRKRVVLRQGEIVSYKLEVNVILYLDYGRESDEKLWKPTVESANKVLKTWGAYVRVSVFIPGHLLPVTPTNFDEIFEISRVRHSTLCVRNKRTGYECKESGEQYLEVKEPKRLKLADTADTSDDC